MGERGSSTYIQTIQVKMATDLFCICYRMNDFNVNVSYQLRVTGPSYRKTGENEILLVFVLPSVHFFGTQAGADEQVSLFNLRRC
jgi:hypothetical protein